MIPGMRIIAESSSFHQQKYNNKCKLYSTSTEFTELVLYKEKGTLLYTIQIIILRRERDYHHKGLSRLNDKSREKVIESYHHHDSSSPTQNIVVT